VNWRDSALNHAKAIAPKESCGLVVNYDGVEVYWECRNIAEIDDCFVIHPADWAEAEDTGVIIAVIHSHGSNSPEPSDMDIKSCKRSKLPWYILSTDKCEWRSCFP